MVQSAADKVLPGSLEDRSRSNSLSSNLISQKARGVIVVRIEGKPGNGIVATGLRNSPLADQSGLAIPGWRGDQCELANYSSI